MKKILFLCLVSFVSFAQVKRQDEKGNPTFYADTLNGMFNGKFIHYNLNGTLAIKGSFINNQKSGVWIYNDSLGNLKHKRNYKNNYEFDNLLNKNDTTPKFILKRDKNNVIVFPKVEDNEIFQARVEYWFIENNKLNSIFFKNNFLWNNIKKYLTKDSIEVYVDSEFNEKLKKGEVYNRIEKFNFEIIGYKIKKFYYYNDKYKIAESRILGICPVIKTKEYDFLIDLLWIYYPDYSECLSGENIKFNNTLISLNDIFIYNYVNSFFYYWQDISIKETSIKLNENLQKLKFESIEYELKKNSFENIDFDIDYSEIARKDKIEYDRMVEKYKTKK